MENEKVENDNLIKQGDLVIVWVNRQNVSAITVDPSKNFGSRFGQFPHSDMIGKPYGSQLTGNKMGFLYLLRMTPELWTLALPHRTQVLYTPDLSFIASRLRLRPGQNMVEAGTGSGSATHSFSAILGTAGTLYSYEFHEKRFTTAQDEFKKHELLRSCGGNTVLTHRNVCEDGFEVEGMDSLNLHAVFLDLPAPWLALPHLDKHIRYPRQCRLCSFLPCIEQVQKMISALRSSGWQSIEMHEVAYRQHQAKKLQKHNVQEAVDRIKAVSENRRRGTEKTKRMRKQQQADARKQADSTEQPHDDQDNDMLAVESGSPSKRPRLGSHEGSKGGQGHETMDQPKNTRQEQAETAPESWQGTQTGREPTPAHPASGTVLNEKQQERLSQKMLRAGSHFDSDQWLDATKVESELRGHTSYLVFATKMPAPPDTQAS